MQGFHTRLRPLALLLATGLIAGCAALPFDDPRVETIAPPASGRSAYDTANVANVTAFYNAAFNAKNFARARFYLGDAYVEHDPEVADGAKGLEAHVSELLAKASDSRRRIEAAYVDGDVVILHVRAEATDEAPAQAIFEIYGLDENGKIVEHWSVAQPIPGDALNANGMFYARSSPEPSPATPEQEERNRGVAIELYERALNDKDWPAAAALVGETYIQHNPKAADGVEGLRRHVESLAADFPENRGDIKAAYTVGDRVILHVHSRRSPEQPGSAVVDMFRIVDGKAVEHWDVVQPIPAEAVNGNGMF